MISHAACGKSWTGLRRAHCPSCHETFNSDSAADKHRVGKHGIDRRCADPATVGLVAVEQPWGTCWQTPGIEGAAWFTATSEEPAA
jgi:hypothetical protein